MVAVLDDVRYRSIDEDMRARARLTLVGSDPARRPPGRIRPGPVKSRVARRYAKPVVSCRVAANRRLAVLLAALVIALGSLLFALQAALGGGAGGPLTTGAASRGAPRPAAAHAWMVRPGDTLWGVAVAVQRHGDVRPLVDRLSAQVGGQPLVVGQRLTLP